MLGFPESDIRLQKNVLDCSIKHQKRHCLSAKTSIQLSDDTETFCADSNFANTSSAVRNHLCVSRRLPKKCSDKASFVKRQSCSSLSRLKQQQLQHIHEDETTKSAGKSLLSLLFIDRKC